MSYPEDLNNLVQQAEALIELGRDPAAEELLRRGLTVDPNSYDIHCILARLLFDQRRFREANDHVERAIAVEPGQDHAFCLQSWILRAIARPGDAIKAADEAVRLNPSDPANWQSLVQAHLNIGEIRAADEAAEQMLALAPDWYLTHQTLALIALKAGRWTEAETHCRRELQLNPLSYEGMNNLGVTFSSQKRKRESIEAFHAAAKMNPARNLARNNLGAEVSSYLPKVGIGVGALWGLMLVLRAAAGMAVQQLWAAGIMLVLILLAALLGYGVYQLFRYVRFRRMPSEVQAYYRIERAQERRKKQVTEGPISRRESYWAVMVVSLVLFALWCYAVWALWDLFEEAANNWVKYGPAVGLLLLALVSFIGYRRQVAKVELDG